MVLRRMRVVDGRQPGPDSGDPEMLTLKVAFAAGTLRRVDQHFGSASALAIFAVTAAGATLLEVAQFGDLAQDHDEHKLLSKLEVLEGCDAVYCLAVGGSAVRQLLALGVQPIKVGEGRRIDGLLSALQDEMAGTPSAWVARVMDRQRRADPARFEAMAEEGWEE